jgi:CubicO group peptidase (beta-lactamase class C family)
MRTMIDHDRRGAARPTRTLLLALLLGLAWPSARLWALTRPDGARITDAQAHQIVSRLIERAHVTGAGIVLFHGGRIAYLHAFGLRDTHQQLPLTPDSVMTAASLTKAAFATLVMRLVEHSSLDLSTPLVQYLSRPLPQRYSDLEGDERYLRFTLGILLSHTSGLQNWRAFEDDRKLRIHFDPGSRFAYSGEGIDLAQLAVERATGKPLESLMQEQLFGPLNMTRTSMVWNPAFEGNFANGYDEQGRSLGPQRRAAADAAGSMQTTLRDYATFLSALLTGEVLGREAMEQMLAPQISIHSAHQFPTLSEATTRANDGIHLAYGIGWGLYDSPYGKAFFKEGHDDGLRHLTLLFAAHGDGILIMTNSANGEGIYKPLFDALLGPTAFPFEWEGYTPSDQLPTTR